MQVKERLQKNLELPFHRFLGLTAIESAAGRGEIFLKVTENVVNSSGIFHGGILYTVCDLCAYGGLLSLLDDDCVPVTHDIHVSVLRPAKLGDTVHFTSEVVKRGRNICFMEVRATVEDRIIATASVTKSLVSIG